MIEQRTILGRLVYAREVVVYSGRDLQGNARISGYSGNYQFDEPLNPEKHSGTLVHRDGVTQEFATEAAAREAAFSAAEVELRSA